MGKLSKILTIDGKIITLQTSKTKAIKLRCSECLGFVTYKYVKECDDDECKLFPYRLGKNPHSGSVRSKAMKDYCAKCAGGNRRYVRNCAAKYCPLYPHRIGAKPNEYKVKRVVRKLKVTKRIRRNV